jgi:hypothetical protein
LIYLLVFWNRGGVFAIGGKEAYTVTLILEGIGAICHSLPAIVFTLISRICCINFYFDVWLESSPTPSV